jgi:hypothetical protein
MVFELVNSHDQQLTRKATVEIQKQSDFEEAKEPGHERNDSNMNAVTFTEGFGLTNCYQGVCEH